jgi:hypothetical protein
VLNTLSSSIWYISGFQMVHLSSISEALLKCILDYTSTTVPW